MANPQDSTQRPEQAASISRRDFIHSLAASKWSEKPGKNKHLRSPKSLDMNHSVF